MELKIFSYLAHFSGEIIGRNFKLGRNLMFQNAKVVCGGEEDGRQAERSRGGPSR